MKLAVSFLVLSLTLVTNLSGLRAQPISGEVAGQQNDDPRRAELYNCWYANRERNATEAYGCGKRFLEQYGNLNDKYDAAIEKFVWEYDNPDKVKFEGLFRLLDAGADGNQPAALARVFAVGESLLKHEPDNLTVLIRLGYSGYIAQRRKIDTYNTAAAAAVEGAIKALENGRTPDESFRGYPEAYQPKSAWIPFSNHDDALAHLYYAQGFILQGSAPDRAAAAFFHATQFETDLKKEPLIYALMAIAFDSSTWEKVSRRYKSLDQGPPADRDAALASLFAATDRLLVYYAHAVALAGDDPLHKQIKDTAAPRLEVLYKFRHENSAAGLPEFVRTAAQEAPADPGAALDAPAPVK